MHEAVASTAIRNAFGKIVVQRTGDVSGLMQKVHREKSSAKPPICAKSCAITLKMNSGLAATKHAVASDNRRLDPLARTRPAADQSCTRLTTATDGILVSSGERPITEANHAKKISAPHRNMPT